MVKVPLHDVLCEVLESKYCYYQPPADIQMKYPCIRYNLAGDNVDYADNIRYHRHSRYTVTVIDYDPDSKIPDRLTDKLPYCMFDRVYSTEGLTHFVYTLFYNGPRIMEENNNG